MKLSSEMATALYFYLLNKDKIHSGLDREAVSKMFGVFKPLRDRGSKEWKEFWKRYKNDD